MNFNSHSDLKQDHAFLSPSQPSWLNYTGERLRSRWQNQAKVQEGTELHELACKMIQKRVRAAPSTKAFNRYVNDAIGFGMVPEQKLYYSEYCFGTADTILYSEKENILRVHDLKTGDSHVDIRQLQVYDALFFLEYGERLKISPFDTAIENRIYQNRQPVLVDIPDGAKIRSIMDTIVQWDLILREENRR